MAEDVPRGIINLAEEQATQKEEARQQKIQEAIVRRILSLQRKIPALEQEVRVLQEREAQLRSTGKNLRAAFVAWRIKKKLSQLSELRNITPSAES